MHQDSFQINGKQWCFSIHISKASHDLWLALGEAKAKCEQLATTLLPPDLSVNLHQIILQKLSAQHVTHAYPAQAVKNIVTAANQILDEAEEKSSQPITIDDLCRYNFESLKCVPYEPQAIPGKVRRHNVTVHRYKPSEWEDCPRLVQQLCDWLNADNFCTPALSGIQLGLLKAIMAHVYIALIHPFGDGNGRTARLLEFRLLIEAGVPAPACHLLSNAYNRDRAAYYNRLGDATRSGCHDQFILYALNGFIGEIDIQLDLIRGHQLTEAWQSYACSTIGDMMSRTSRRQFSLILALAHHDEWIPACDIPSINAHLGKAFRQARRGTCADDIKRLEGLGLIEVSARGVRAHKQIVLAFLPRGRHGQFERTINKTVSL